jgi:hypothetical protein
MKGEHSPSLLPIVVLVGPDVPVVMAQLSFLPAGSVYEQQPSETRGRHGANR